MEEVGRSISRSIFSKSVIKFKSSQDRLKMIHFPESVSRAGRSGAITPKRVGSFSPQKKKKKVFRKCRASNTRMEIDRREIGSNQLRVIRQCGNCQGFRKWKRHFEIGFPRIPRTSDEFSIFRASHNPVSYRGWVDKFFEYTPFLSLSIPLSRIAFCNRTSLARGLNETTKGSSPPLTIYPQSSVQSRVYRHIIR